MGIQRTAVSVLFVLLVLVSSTAAQMVNNTVICYLLDGILLLYCIIATAFYIREKLCLPPEAQSPDEGYEDVDTATRTRARRKRRQEAGGDIYQSLQAEERSKDTYETLGQQTSAPLPPQ